MNPAYLWNMHTLEDWLRLKMASGESAEHIIQELGISHRTLQEWMSFPFPTITLTHLQAIARSRDWSVGKTARWLEIKPNHLAELQRARSIEPAASKGRH